MSAPTPSPAGGSDPARRAARELWPNLPVLLVGSALVALGWVLVRAAADVTPWLSVPGVGLLVIPLFAVLLRGCEVLLSQQHFGFADLVRTLPRSYGRALGITVVPTLLATLTCVALLAWQRSGSGLVSALMLVSVAVGAVLSGLAAYTGVVALPYAVRTGASPREVWPAALYVATRNPMLVLGVASAAALAVWAAAYLSFALVLLLPAPLALLWASAVGASLDRSRRRLADRPAARS